MPDYQRVVLISDLHLCESRPDISRAFFKFLDQVAPRYEALFILGDFFEYWVGDDAATAFHQDIARRLRRLSELSDVFLMVGNRDFALGDDFASQCNARLLPDPCVAHLGSADWLLSHGDALCTDDVHYQRYRRVIRHPWVLALLRRLPLRSRLALAKRLRQTSRNRYLRETESIIDVNHGAVQLLLESESVSGLIHGHTHLADWHYHETAQGRLERLVLGDWHHFGWYLSIDRNDKALHRFAVAEPDFESA